MPRFLIFIYYSALEEKVLSVYTLYTYELFIYTGIYNW